ATTIGRRFGHQLAAAIVRKDHALGCCGAGFAGGSRAGAECLDAPPRASHLRVSRPENVEAVLAEPRSPAIRMFFRSGVCVRGAALVQAARKPCDWRTDLLAWRGGSHCECLHLSRPGAACMELQAHGGRIFSYRDAA